MADGYRPRAGRRAATLASPQVRVNQVGYTSSSPKVAFVMLARPVSRVSFEVKPDIILVADDESIFLVDFGIAKITGDVPLTSTRTVMGTAEFLAPERIRGEEAGPAADLWSLGVTLFYALEGYSPFLRDGGSCPEATMWAILSENPPLPSPLPSPPCSPPPMTWTAGCCNSSSPPSASRSCA